jgi:predicted nuclease of predicted toxin-antitoxin system
VTGGVSVIWVLDQGVPRDVATLLRNLGHECTHVGEIGMARATGGEILAFALEGHAIVVTLDADFHSMVAVSGARGPSVIRLRMQGLGAREIVELLQSVLARFDADLSRGSLVTIKSHKVTCHRLPIGSSD